MIIHNSFSQSSLEWLAARAGVCTASEFDEIMTPKFKARDGKMVESYLCRKLAEKWIGPLPSFQTLDMSFGQIKEEIAIPFYEGVFNEKIQQVALITDDKGQYGCSPDGLLGEDGGVEIKCPRAENHLKYLRAKELPDEYALQVHGCLYVTGRKFWKFVSFHPKFPIFVTTVYRDEEKCELISDTLTEFLAKLDDGFKELVKMNGGERPRIFTGQPQAEPKMESESLDVIP